MQQMPLPKQMLWLGGQYFSLDPFFPKQLLEILHLLLSWNRSNNAPTDKPDDSRHAHKP